MSKFQIDLLAVLTRLAVAIEKMTVQPINEPSLPPVVAPPPNPEPPQLPMACYGKVINGKPGMTVEARVDGGVFGPNNPVKTDDQGVYGAVPWDAQKLLVQGPIAANAPIKFFVNGRNAWIKRADDTVQSALPFVSGAISEVNLSV
jgi:hypothetical protein